MTGKLDGKVAIVTGASSGIGEATALALAVEGASVVITARRADRLDTLAQRIQEKGGKALSLTVDVTDEAQARQMIERTKTEFGRADILVNNAGVMLLGPVGGADTEDWRRMVNTNILGLMYCTHAALPLMEQQGSTKWAVGGFSEALRQEVYKHSIRVTIIEPGAVATELLEHITVPKVKADMQQWVSSLNALKSEDIAAAIVYAVTQPPHVNVNEILIRPTEQER